MTSLEEKKGTMNSKYFGFMSKRRNPIKGYKQHQLEVGFNAR